MVTVTCDHCEQIVDQGFPAGVNVKFGKRVELRFHLCEFCMTSLEERTRGFLELPPKVFTPT